MLRIWLDLEDRAFIPTFMFLELCIEVDLNAVTDLNGHDFLRLKNQNNASPIPAEIAPLIAHCGLPVMKLPGRMLIPVVSR